MESDRILLSHGSGGKMTHFLIDEIFLEEFKNEILLTLGDSAVIKPSEGRLAFTTDSYVVDPIFFPNGDIGKLSVCGTINDLAMSGAKPLYLSVSFIIEEGFLIADLKAIVKSMKISAHQAGVKIVCGDTKVVPKGAADKIFITTTGLGIIPEGVEILPSRIRPGDQIILNGSIGEHGIAILNKREGFDFQTNITSDVAPLNHLVCLMLNEVKDGIHALRDPTRGGVATVLNEFVRQTNVGIRIYEDKLPIQDSVRGICELLGLDPLYVANEGKLVAITSKESADNVLSCMRKIDKKAMIIGEVIENPQGIVSLVTSIGGIRRVDMLTGEQLPRIC